MENFKSLQIKQNKQKMFYEYFLRPILFKFDAEHIHNSIVNFCSFLGNYGFIRNILKKYFYYENEKLNTKIGNIELKNPIGLSAGFDKDCQLYKFMPSLGFGFLEIGSVTFKSCKGNPKPRLVRLPKDKSIIVYYGLKNKGAGIISEKLKNEKFEIPTGISIAKTNNDKIKGEKSVQDYVNSFKLIHSKYSIGDYITVNISCPNTADGTNFCNPVLLPKLLKEIAKCKITKPIFLKISPDISKENIDKILKIVSKYSFVTGFIISNLTKNRKKLKLKSTEKELNQLPQGGLSGKPVEKLSNNMIEYIYKKTKGKYIIIGCGGIFSAEDAYKKIKLGASAVQLITGMIYKGPGIIKEINLGLVNLLEKDGFNNIKEAVGSKFR